MEVCYSYNRQILTVHTVITENILIKLKFTKEVINRTIGFILSILNPRPLGKELFFSVFFQKVSGKSLQFPGTHVIID